MKKEIVGYEGFYWINEEGEIFNKHGRKLKWGNSSHGYYIITLHKNNKLKTFFAHRLVAITFNLKKESGQDVINHIDFDKKNNHISNLEWCTQKENVHHALKNGRRNNTYARKRKRKIIEHGVYIYKKIPAKYIIWRVYEVKNGVRKYIKCYKSLEEAKEKEKMLLATNK